MLLGQKIDDKRIEECFPTRTQSVDIPKKDIGLLVVETTEIHRDHSLLLALF